MPTKVLLTILFIVNSILALGQVKIQGKVLATKDGKPIPYADVKLPELKINTTTNTDGSFYIESPKNASKLIISKSGFKNYNYEIVDKVDFSFLAEMDVDDQDFEEDGITLETASVIGGKKNSA